jgi:flavin-binding protein dodecin
LGVRWWLDQERPRGADVIAVAGASHKEVEPMTVAKVTEITATSTKSFQDAIAGGIERANKTLKNISGAWLADQEVVVENGKITLYKVRMRVTFVLV